jgi:acetyl esterase
MVMTVAEHLVLDPTTQAFVGSLAAQKGKPIYELSYKDARKVLEDLQAKPVTKLPADIEDKVLPVGPTGEVSVRIFRPQNSKGRLPTVMYFHGGGWVLGSKDTHDRLLRDLTNGAQAAFVFVNYTPLPRRSFPYPLSRTTPRPNISRNTARNSASIRTGSLWRATVSAATWSPS